MSNSTPLAELNAMFVGAGGTGVFNADGSPAEARVGVGVMMDCPCGECGDPLYVPFANPIDGGPPLRGGGYGWQRNGETLERLTLSPSVLRAVEKGGCGWHGFIREGKVVEA